MAMFIKCYQDSITYLRGEVVRNNPVNVSHCKQIRKGRFAWYPDNTGKASIVFEGCDVEWVYDTESARDEQFEEIASNQFK